MKAKELRQYLDKFLTSPAAQQARVQIEMPNQEKNFNEKGFWFKLDYYFQTFLALCIFLYVADKILNWFVPGYQ